MKRIQAIVGILGGLFWVGLAIFVQQGNLSGAALRNAEVFWNRLWTPALIGMLIGFNMCYQLMRFLLPRTGKSSFLVFHAGFALMILGNFVEYWIFSDLPHQGPNAWIRGVAWMTFLFGAMLMLSASTVAGFSMARTSQIPMWLSMSFVLLLPLTLAIGFLNMGLTGIPIGSLGIMSSSFSILSEPISLAPVDKT